MALAAVTAVGEVEAIACPSAYKIIFRQVSFSYDTIPEVVRIKISATGTQATSNVGPHTLNAPLRKL